MSIEQKIEELTEAVKALTAAIKEAGKNVNVSGNKGPEVPNTVPPAQEVPAPPAAATEAPSQSDTEETVVPVPPPPPATEAPQQVVPPAPAAAPPTIDEVNAALVAKAQQIGAEGAAKIRGMLQDQFGVTGISQIPAERLGEVLTATEALA